MFAALASIYHNHGLNVLPIVPGEKHPPHNVRWQRWQRKRQTRDEVTQLSRQHPDMDIAGILGRISGNLVDIETDGDEGEVALRELRLPLPPTACWESPRGVHRLYRTLRPVPSCVGKTSLAPKVDVLSERRYAVMPTSRGRTWLTQGFLDYVAPLPREWEEKILAQGQPRGDLQEAGREGAKERTRNQTLARLVGRWQTQLLPGHEILRRAQDYAEKCESGSHPFTPEEAHRTAVSVIHTRERSRLPGFEIWRQGALVGLELVPMAVLMGLATLWIELGCPEEFGAPARMVARYGRVGRSSVSHALRVLAERGFIRLSKSKDTRDREVGRVALCPSRMPFLFANHPLNRSLQSNYPTPKDTT